ncbi:MFS transporter [Sphingomonas immobilis]|uniref:MFS transporter n=1 Tax=Sphingomonas immobilis TaxID=3063997 RepID=A0ABT8ZX54_9SPHN|nr:MFS transporter [Sphingomonas sp. CA1-15]MDO7842144.1 MFS transporter [Sphingomonas sp. CA1-15]
MLQQAIDAGSTRPGTARPYARWYPAYVLILLALANTFNYLDRNIISILAEAIKADLKVSDAQIGFLNGTIFAALYAIFGMPMGRLADRSNQPRLMGIGLSLWSAMTAFSGFASSFAMLSLARVGVSVGEATANPCSHAIIAGYFQPVQRARAYAVYLAGIFLGMGCALAIGGVVLHNWAAFSAQFSFLQGTPAWKATFWICGIPGLILALLIFRVPDPRAAQTAAVTVSKGSPWIGFLADVAAVLPPTSFFAAARRGRGVLVWNLIAGAGLAALAATLSMLTGDWQQWTALGFATYAVFAFAQMIRWQDKPLFALTFGTRSFRYLVIGMSAIACIHNALLFWAVPYLLRTFKISAASGGVTMGIILALAGGLGIAAGGYAADVIRRRDLRASIWITLTCMAAAMPAAVVMFTTGDVDTFYVAFTIFAFFHNAWAASSAAVIQELVLPRMRATGAGSFSMLIIVSNFALGPYLVGKVSTVTGSLAFGSLAMYALAPVGIYCLLRAVRTVPADIADREARAHARGEAQLATSL